jgi:hypothetical protein
MLRSFACEQRPLRQHQMHACGLHPVEPLDRARELPLKCAQVIDVLHEAGRAERVRLVENLVADAATLGQARFGELHAQPRYAILRHQHDRAVVLELVGDGLTFQVLHDRRRVLEGEVGEQRRHLRGRDPQHQQREEADQRDRDRAHRRDPPRTQRFEELDESLHLCPTPATSHQAILAGRMVTGQLTGAILIGTWQSARPVGVLDHFRDAQVVRVDQHDAVGRDEQAV